MAAILATHSHLFSDHPVPIFQQFLLLPSPLPEVRCCRNSGIGLPPSLAHPPDSNSNHGFKWHYNACDSQIYVSSIYIYYLSSEQAQPVIYFTSVLDSLTKLSKLMCPNGVFNYPQVCLTHKSFPSQKTKLSSTQIHTSGTWRLSLMLLSSSPTSNLSANSVNSIRKT